MNNKLEISPSSANNRIHDVSLSVITLTRNRAHMLALCLGSLVGQLGKKDEIVIIDNNSTDPTYEVVRSLQSELPIHYYKSSITGYPRLYNLAIKKSTKEILVFLDDDCVASSNYISAVRQAHREHIDAVIQGQTHSLPRHNIYAEIMGDHYQNWLEANRLSDGTLRTFDNKNASLPRTLIEKYGVFLDELIEGSEDVELGIRLRRHEVEIIFDPRVIAYHHERLTFMGFLQQHLRIARSEGILDKALAQEDKIHMLYAPKLYLHIKGALVREIQYLTQGRLRGALLLPILGGESIPIFG